MSPQAYYRLFQQLMEAFAPHYREAVGQVMKETGLKEHWFAVFAAHALAPEPLVRDFFVALEPRDNPERRLRALQQAAAADFLATEDRKAYTLTDSGRKAMTRFFDAAQEALAAIQPLPESDLDRLGALLNRISAATARARKPSHKPHFELIHQVAPDPEAPTVVQIEHVLTELVMYREDVHIAGRAAMKVSAPAGEALDVIGRGEADSVAALTAALGERRGYGEADYATAVATLVEKGWVSQTDDVLVVTAEGQAALEEAAALTDRLYVTGWKNLKKAEVTALDKLLARLLEDLPQPAEPEAVVAVTEIYPLIEALHAELWRVSRPAMMPVLAGLGLDQPGLSFTLRLAVSLAPEPVSTAIVGPHFPFASPEVWTGRFDDLVALDYLVRVVGGGYRLTPAGRGAHDHLTGALIQHLDHLTDTIRPALPAADLERLAGLLQAAVTACLKQADSTDERAVTPWTLQRSHRLAPAADAPALARIDQAVDDLSAFRNDAHRAAFAALAVAGPAWEFFTFLWRGDVADAAEMAGRAAHRGYGEVEYAAALVDLVRRDWVEAGHTGYQLTETGRRVREEAEERTDHHFYASWSELPAVDIPALAGLLRRLRQALAAIPVAEPLT